jgi:hypothetical protein
MCIKPAPQKGSLGVWSSTPWELLVHLQGSLVVKMHPLGGLIILYFSLLAGSELLSTPTPAPDLAADIGDFTDPIGPITAGATCGFVQAASLQATR